MEPTCQGDTPQITDKDSLKLWLPNVDRNAGQKIANRAAMRVLPLAWDWLLTTTGTEVTQPALTCAFYAINAAKTTQKRLPEQVQLAIFHNTDYAARASQTGHHGIASALSAITFAATAAILPNAQLMRGVTNAVGSAASAFGHEMATPNIRAEIEKQFWAEIQADCMLICHGDAPDLGPIWHMQQPPFGTAWQNITEKLAGKPEWADWLEWHQAFETGTPFTLDLLAI